MITQLLEVASPDELRRTRVDILLLNVSCPSRCRNHLAQLLHLVSEDFAHVSSRLFESRLHLLCNQCQSETCIAHGHGRVQIPVRAALLFPQTQYHRKHLDLRLARSRHSASLRRSHSQHRTSARHRNVAVPQSAYSSRRGCVYIP